MEKKSIDGAVVPCVGYSWVLKLSLVNYYEKKLNVRFLSILFTGIMILTIILTNYFTHQQWYFWHWSKSASTNYDSCHGLRVHTVWNKTFPKLKQQGNIISLDVNNDKVLDVVFGFGTGVDGYNVPEIVCNIYFIDTKPCMGGIMALDGRNGDTIWTFWSRHEIFTLSCQNDLNSDNITDCIAGGRAGLLLAISGIDGSLLWNFNSNHIAHTDLMSMYTPQLVHDIDGDGISDAVIVHGGDELSDPAHEYNLFGRIMIISGKTGKVLRWVPTPDGKESYYPPQILTWLDGEMFVLIGTGANSKPGSLFILPLSELYKGNISEVSASLDGCAVL